MWEELLIYSHKVQLKSNTLNDEKRLIEQNIRLINDDSLLTELIQQSYKKAMYYNTANIVEMYTDCLSKIKNT